MRAVSHQLVFIVHERQEENVPQTIESKRAMGDMSISKPGCASDNVVSMAGFEKSAEGLEAVSYSAQFVLNMGTHVTANGPAATSRGAVPVLVSKSGGDISGLTGLRLRSFCAGEETSCFRFSGWFLDGADGQSDPWS